MGCQEAIISMRVTLVQVVAVSKTKARSDVSFLLSNSITDYYLYNGDVQVSSNPSCELTAIGRMLI